MSIHLLCKQLLSRKVVTILLLVQLVLTLALVLNSVLLTYQTHSQLTQPTGLDMQRILAVQLKPTSPQLRVYPALTELLERQLAAIRQIPGVEAVAYSNQSVLQMGGNSQNVYLVEHEERTNIANVPSYFVSKDYFKVMGLQVLAGEIPEYRISPDTNGRAPVVITRSLAEPLLDGKLDIGQSLNFGPLAAVVENFYGQRTSENVMYNILQVAPPVTVDWGYALMVRTSANSTEAVQQQLANVLRQTEPDIEIYNIRSLQEQQHLLYRNEYGLAVLLAMLSGLMLLVTMISSYSSAHFRALKSQQEIGIKRALGASKQRVFIELLSENWLTTLIGSLAGAVAALMLNRLLSYVISIPPISWWLPFITGLVLLLCVTVATWYPAAIATRISPASATKAL